MLKNFKFLAPVLFCSAILLLAYGYYLYSLRNQVSSFELTEPFQKNYYEFSVDNSANVALALKAEIKSSSVQEREKSDPIADPDFKIRYSFPLSYTISGENGEEIFSEDTTLNWNSLSGSIQSGTITVDGGSAEVSSFLREFHSDFQNLKVEFKIGPDNTYHSNIVKAQLLAYDSVHLFWPYLVAGVYLLVIAYYVHKWQKAEGREVSEKKRALAFVICFFVGMLGIHRFYVGRYISGTFMIVTLGGLGFWAFLDLWTLLFGWFLDRDGKRISNWG